MTQEQISKPRIIELKTDPDAFDATAKGEKTFEIRYNDREYKIGDTLLLRRTRFSGAEMRNDDRPLEYTGEEITVTVTHVQTGYGIANGWAALSHTSVAHARYAGDSEPVAFAFRDMLTGDLRDFSLCEHSVGMIPLYTHPVGYAGRGEAVGEVFDFNVSKDDRDHQKLPILYEKQKDLPAGTKLYTHPAPAVPELDDLFKWSKGWREYDDAEPWTTEDRMLYGACRSIHAALIAASKEGQ